VATKKNKKKRKKNKKEEKERKKKHYFFPLMLKCLPQTATLKYPQDVLFL